MADYLYDLIIGIPISLIVAILMMDRIGGDGREVAVSVVICMVLAIYASIKYIRSKARWLILPVPLLVLGFYIMTAKQESIVNASLQYKWVLWSIILAVLGLLIAKLSSLNRWAMRVIFFALIGYMLYALFNHKHVSQVMVALVLFVLISEIIIELQRRWVKRGYTNERAHLVFVAPFVIIPCLIIACSTAPAKPYDWKLVTVLWNNATEMIKSQFGKMSGGDEEYWKAYMGFDEKNRLADSVDVNPQDIMQITYEQRYESPLYLRGCTYDTFENFEWTTRYETSRIDYLMDTMETVGAIYKFDPSHTSRYMASATINVHYDMITSKYVFIPAKARMGEAVINDMPIIYQGDNLFFDKRRGYGTNYLIDYYMLNRSYEGFSDLLELSQALDKDTWSSVNAKYFSSYDCDKSYDSYLLYRENIYKTYLGDVVLSDELRSYMDNLLEGADSDIEKLQRIEDMLSGFSYTLTPGPMPEDVDSTTKFLDYFILEKKEGYCSYFASAFVLLARAEGIPARYAEGFYVIKTKGKEITVTSDKAHAWPEVYIDGFGWINYEPTPGYKSLAGWIIDKLTENAGLSDSKEIDSIVDFGGVEIVSNLEKKDTPEVATDQEDIGINKRLVGIISIVVIITLILIYIVDRITVSMWYKKQKDAKKHDVIYHRIMKILTILGYSMEQGETLEEFAYRIQYTQSEDDNKLSIGIPINIKEFLHIREEIAYAKRDVNTKDVTLAESVYKELNVYFKGRIHWFYLRQILIERIE